MKWYTFKRGVIQPYRVYPIMKGIAEMGIAMNPTRIDTGMYLNIGNNLWWCWDARQLENLGKYLLKLAHNRRARLQHFRKLEKTCEHVIAIAEHVRKKDLNGIDNKGLLSLYKKLDEASTSAHAITNSVIDAIDFYPVDYFRKKIISYLPDTLS